LLDGDGKDFDPLSYERILHYLNLFKKIYSIRDKYVGDPRYMEVSVDDLISNDFLNSYGDVDAESGECSDGDTTYFAVVDSEGNILSGIQSLFHPFGSKITEPTYGITLNSRASSFTLIDGHVNSIEPGKRPLHTLSTPILIGEDRVIAHGLSGGHFRPQLHTEIISNMLIYGMDPQDALEHARFVWVPGKDKVIVEEGFVIPPMKDVEMVKYGSRLGVAALLVSYHDSIKCGCVDIRGEGLAIGDV
jgi:gamma-glutamyltranspeptidase/glutathione hydrolase